MDFKLNEVDVVEGKIVYTTGDGTEVTEELTLTALINIIIAFINALIKAEI